MTPRIANCGNGLPRLLAFPKLKLREVHYEVRIGIPNGRTPPPSRLEYQPAAPAEESNSPTTAGSRVCRGCSLDQPRTPQSTARLLQPLPGWPSHAGRPPRL